METQPLNRTAFGALPHRLDPFGQVARTHDDRFGRLRFADNGGDGSGAGGDGDGSGDGNGDGDGEGDLGDAGKKALDRMKQARNTAQQQLKAYADLGLTPDQVKELAEARAAAQTPDEKKIREELEPKIRAELETKVNERAANRLRGAEVRAQAAELGFIKPAQALALLDQKSLAEVDVDLDEDTVDAASVKKLLEALAKDSPHLVKPTDKTPSHQAAGIGSGSSGNSSENVGTGTSRLRHAYAEASK